MDVDTGGVAATPQSACVALVSRVRVHAEGLADRLRTITCLRNVTVTHLEDCTPSQLERKRPDLILVDASSVPAGTLVDTLGATEAVTVANMALKLVAYGLADRDEDSLIALASIGATGFILK